MKKGNIIDLVQYREEHAHETDAATVVSEELESAIETLIYRLRELGPLQQSN